MAPQSSGLGKNGSTELWVRGRMAPQSSGLVVNGSTELWVRGRMAPQSSGLGEEWLHRALG